MRPSPKITVVGAERPTPSVRWTVRGTTVDYTFYAALRDLADVLAEAGCDESVAEADGLLTFGYYDVCQGGGSQPWLAVRPSDGRVFAFDAESDDPLRLLNSSLEAFTATFNLLDSVLQAGRPVPSNLVQSLRAVDPSAFDDSEWSDFADYVRAA